MNIVKNRISEMQIDPSGVLYIKILKKMDVDLDDVVDTFMTAKNLTKDLPWLVLVDTRQKKSITSKARKLIEKENVPARHIAKAVIVNSTIKKNFHNFLTRFTNTRFPVRTFTSEKDARNWLRSGN